MRLRPAVIGTLAALVAALASLAWFAAPGRALPWSSVHVIELAAGRFASPTGAVRHDGDWLTTGEPDALGRSVLLSDEGLALAAAEFRHLRLRFDRLPPTVRPVLVWTTREAGNRNAAIPWTDAGGVVDLGKLDGWAGTIDRIGLAFVPLDTVPIAAVALQPIAFGGLELRSDSRSGAIAALWTEWTAIRPWNGRSINTGGFELPVEPGLRPLAWLAGSIAVGLVVAFALGSGRWPRRAWLVAAALILWLALDLLQLGRLAWRAESAHAARSGQLDGGPLTAVTGLSGPIAELQAALDRLPAGVRVLVYGNDAFTRQYPVFLLREHDVAPLPSPAALPADVERQRPVLVLFGGGEWRFDPATATLAFADHRLSADPIPLGGQLLQAYRLGRGDQ